jgi:hypothetical protein
MDQSNGTRESQTALFSLAEVEAMTRVLVWFVATGWIWSKCMNSIKAPTATNVRKARATRGRSRRLMKRNEPIDTRMKDIKDLPKEALDHQDKIGKVIDNRIDGEINKKERKDNM